MQREECYCCLLKLSVMCIGGHVLRALLLLVVSLQDDAHAQSSDTWSYIGVNGPDHWHVKNPLCRSSSNSYQSPVDIQTSAVTPSAYAPFVFEGYDNLKDAFLKFTNTGQTVLLRIGGNMSLSGGGLNGVFKASHAHVHWGAHSGRGSEHTINGKSYPLEVHIVHYNILYPNEQAASNKENGLAVLGVMGEIGKTPNRALNPLFEAASQIIEPGASVVPPRLTRFALLPKNKNIFYRYQGSLTTPGCFQTVTWTIFKDTIRVSESQLEKLRALHASDGSAALVDNYRPPQELNGRLVYMNTG